MCGRYALTVEPAVLSALLALRDLAEFDPRWNLAPSQSAPVVTRDDAREGRALRSMRWGLVPSWSKDSKIGYHTINARSETAATKPAFRSAYRKRRCLVPASWFYEWRKEGKEKTPFRIQRADGAPLVMAGLFESWRGSATEAPRTTFTILTTTANEDMEGLHDRMPCLLGREDHDRWLDVEHDDMDAVAALLRPAPAGTLEHHRVSQRVGNVRNEGPELLTPDTLF